MLRIFILLSFLLLNGKLFAQSNDSVIDVPSLVTLPYYTAHTTFVHGDIKHEVDYNDPHAIDEEFSHDLEFHFHSFDSIVPGKTYDLVKDTDKVIATYGLFSVWNWEMSPKTIISGTITVTSKTKTSIVINEDVTVRDEYGRRLIFKTSCTFSRTKTRY